MFVYKYRSGSRLRYIAAFLYARGPWRNKSAAYYWRNVVVTHLSPLRSEVEILLPSGFSTERKKYLSNLKNIYSMYTNNMYLFVPMSSIFQITNIHMEKKAVFIWKCTAKRIVYLVEVHSYFLVHIFCFRNSEETKWHNRETSGTFKSTKNTASNRKLGRAHQFLPFNYVRVTKNNACDSSCFISG